MCVCVCSTLQATRTSISHVNRIAFNTIYQLHRSLCRSKREDFLHNFCFGVIRTRRNEIWDDCVRVCVCVYILILILILKKYNRSNYFIIYYIIILWWRNYANPFLFFFVLFLSILEAIVDLFVCVWLISLEWYGDHRRQYTLHNQMRDDDDVNMNAAVSQTHIITIIILNETNWAFNNNK